MAGADAARYPADAESQAELARILSYRDWLERGARRVRERVAKLGWGLVSELFHSVRKEPSEQVEEAVQDAHFASVMVRAHLRRRLV